MKLFHCCVRACEQTLPEPFREKKRMEGKGEDLLPKLIHVQVASRTSTPLPFPFPNAKSYYRIHDAQVNKVSNFPISLLPPYQTPQQTSTSPSSTHPSAACQRRLDYLHSNHSYLTSIQPAPNPTPHFRLLDSNARTPPIVSLFPQSRYYCKHETMASRDINPIIILINTHTNTRKP